MTQDTISSAELLWFSIDRRLGRVVAALENGNRGVDVLALEVSRLADAFGNIADTLSCLTESVEGKDGVARCTVRTHAISPNVLSFQDSSEDE
jgi:hypothetical protein